jgi:hypothetical protein
VVHAGKLTVSAIGTERVEMTAVVIHRVVGGKLVEKWSNKDVLGFLQQLGVIPQPGGSPHQKVPD